MSLKLRKAIDGRTFRNKSGSLTTKNKNKGRNERNISFINIKNPNNKNFLKNSKSVSNFKVKKIKTTGKLIKPAETKIEAVPENEGSSWKNSKSSLIKPTSSEREVQKP